MPHRDTIVNEFVDYRKTVFAIGHLLQKLDEETRFDLSFKVCLVGSNFYPFPSAEIPIPSLAQHHAARPGPGSFYFVFSQG